jgi:CheY-like chemotaxis protein
MARKLFLADDSVIIQKTVESVLAGLDFELTVFRDGEEAFKAIQNEAPDTLLAATDLKGLDGYALCNSVKQEPSLSHVKVILIAPVVEGINQKKADESGADERLTKPFTPEELFGVIISEKDYKNVIAELTKRLRECEDKINMTKKVLVEKILREAIPSIENAIISDLRETIESEVVTRIPYAVERIITEKINEIRKS